MENGARTHKKKGFLNSILMLPNGEKEFTVLKPLHNFIFTNPHHFLTRQNHHCLRRFCRIRSDSALLTRLDT